MRIASAVRLVVWMMAVMSMARIADAQDRLKGFGYLFVAPGAVTCQQGHVGCPTVGYLGNSVKTSASSVTIGGGGEFLLSRWVGFAPEGGWLRGFNESRGIADNVGLIGFGVGTISANASVHLIPTDSPHRVRPFVKVGGGSVFRGSGIPMWNVGAGVDYWMRPRAGLRVELHDQIYQGYYYHGVQSKEIRFGIAFH
jgi:hypothetical protein